MSSYGRELASIGVVLLVGCGHGFFDPQQPCDGGGSAGPAVVYRQAASNYTPSTTFIAAPLPLAILDGDVLVVVVGYETSAAISSVTDTLGNSYMAVIGPTVTTGAWAQEMFVTRSAAAGPGANIVEVSMTQGANVRVSVGQYGNVDPTQPIDTAVAKIGASSSTVTPGPIMTAHAHDLLFVAGTSDGALQGVLPGFNVRESAGDHLTEDMEVTTADTYNPAAPAGTNSNWIMQMVALRGL